MKNHEDVKSVAVEKMCNNQVNAVSINHNQKETTILNSYLLNNPLPRSLCDRFADLMLPPSNPPKKRWPRYDFSFIKWFENGTMSTWANFKTLDQNTAFDKLCIVNTLVKKTP